MIIGNVSLIASKKAKNIICVEINKDAIKNPKRNKITNAYFYNDDAEDYIVGLSKTKEKIHTVFMDTPRSCSMNNSYPH